MKSPFRDLTPQILRVQGDKVIARDHIRGDDVDTYWAILSVTNNPESASLLTRAGILPSEVTSSSSWSKSTLEAMAALRSL